MTDRASAWSRLPVELTAYAQWAVAGASKAPLSVRADGNLYNVSVTRPGEWLTFEAARQIAWDNRELVTTFTDKTGHTQTQIGLDIGFILNDIDPFTIIDLDVKDYTTHPNTPAVWTDPEEFAKYETIYKTFNSYTEISKRGKGLHIVTRGDIGRGFRRDGIEVYSRERFIICTGQVLVDEPIGQGQFLLDNMIQQMRPLPKALHLEEIPADVDDWMIVEIAASASNGEKFWKLWKGEWDGFGFPSHSEADLALMSMFTFYSPSNEQCRRLFRESALGQREKARKDNRYLDFTLTTIRNRQAREQSADFSKLRQSLEEVDAAKAEIARLQGGAPAIDIAAPRAVLALGVARCDNPIQAPPPPSVAAAALAPVTEATVLAGEEGLPWPPGFVGVLSKFIYETAPRQVKEVAVVAALGLMAGLCGKAWHIPQSGLNLYIILIARSAVGKEAMHSGISALLAACGSLNPQFHNFVDFTEYASGPALVKACLARPCFVNVSGEWGRRLKRLAQEDNREGPLQTLRTQMTNLYQKSGPASILGGIGYSAVDNNVDSVRGVSYSMIGETTPGTFYEALTESMMEDGFLSRFLTIEYDGKRPIENPRPTVIPSDGLCKALCAICTQATGLIARNSSQQVNRTADAQELIANFNLECDFNINSTDDESRRQMWNRAALKSLRIAGLLAVGDNYLTPVITSEHVVWAQDVVMRDIAMMKRKLDGGDVGVNDSSRERKLVTTLKDYIGRPLAPSYGVPELMRDSGIVPRSYLQIRLQKSPAFMSHRNGSNKALEDTLMTMIASGYLSDAPKDKVAEAYNYHGKSYRILKLPNYEELSKN